MSNMKGRQIGGRLKLLRIKLLLNLATLLERRAPPSGTQMSQSLLFKGR
jgi:hypothetical protein